MAFKNPFAAENRTEGGGGGFWNNKTITILEAGLAVDAIKNWVDPNTGLPGISNVLFVKGVDEDGRERREAYSTGQNRPSTDGKHLVKPDGTQTETFVSNCHAAFFADALIKGGFDVEKLFNAETGAFQLENLVGAQFEFYSVERKNKEGGTKKSKDGKYTEYYHLPSKFVGYVAGRQQTGASSGNGAVVREKAIATVTEILGEAGGKVSRVDLIRKLQIKLSKDTDANKVLALIAKPDFHQDAPWTSDGAGYSL